jgi:hypothetical protein
MTHLDLLAPYQGVARGEHISEGQQERLEKEHQGNEERWSNL